MDAEEEIKILKGLVETHIKEYRITIREMRDKHKTQTEMQEQILITLRELAIAQKTNNESIANLTKATSDIVIAWNTVSNLQKFIKWSTPIVVFIGAAMAWVSIKFNIFKP